MTREALGYLDAMRKKKAVARVDGRYYCEDEEEEEEVMASQYWC